MREHVHHSFASVCCWSVCFLSFAVLFSHPTVLSFLLTSCFFPFSFSVRLIAKQQWQPWQICALAHRASHLTLAYPLLHKHTHAIQQNVMLVYDTPPKKKPKTKKKRMSPWSVPSHWGDRREASSWMDLLCCSPEGFDPLPFIPQIRAYPAILERGLTLSWI